MTIEEQPDIYIELPCSRCSTIERTWKNKDIVLRKFLIDALGNHALCKECGFRVQLNQIPQLNTQEDKQNGKIK